MSSLLPDDIEYKFSLAQDPDPELGHYLIAFCGSACWWDTETAGERQLAEIRGQRLALAAALDDGLDQGGLLDSVSAELSEFSETVLHDERCLLPATEAPRLRVQGHVRVQGHASRVTVQGHAPSRVRSHIAHVAKCSWFHGVSRPG